MTVLTATMSHRGGWSRARLGRLEFCATCREPDLAVCVATGDIRLYANILILLTVGYIPPSS